MLGLTLIPLWIFAFLLLVPATLIAMAGPYLIRRYVHLSRLRLNNEVAGFKFATVGVLYAVLLAFAIIVVWEKFNEAETEVEREAGALVTIYRLSEGLGAEAGGALRDAVSEYIKTVIAADWPAMERGKGDMRATRALGNVYASIRGYAAKDNRETVLLAEILRQVDLVTQGRRGRLVIAAGVVPGIVWMVLWTGACITVGFTFFFGAENLRAQSIMTGMLSFLIFSGLLTIIAIDHPFAGTVKVKSEALSAILEEFGGGSRP